jgi:hypothetical protein
MLRDPALGPGNPPATGAFGVLDASVALSSIHAVIRDSELRPFSGVRYRHPAARKRAADRETSYNAARVTRTVTTRIAMAMVLTSGAAHGAPTARLVYSRGAGAESCPDETALRRAVAVRVGYDPFFPLAKKTVVVRMAPAKPRGFDASVDLVDDHGMDHGARVIHTDAACGELLDVVGLGIAIAIDPQSLMGPSSPPPAPAPPRPPESTPASATTTSEAAAGNGTTASEASGLAEKPPHFFWASLGAAASAGVAPRPTAGLSFGAASQWGHASLGVEALVDAPVSASASAASGGGSASAWLARLAILPCAYGGPMLLCALAEAGSMQASGEGFPGARSMSILWLAAGGRVGVDVPLGESPTLRVQSDVAGTFRPPSLQVHGTSVWSAPPVSASLGAELVVHFP